MLNRLFPFLYCAELRHRPCVNKYWGTGSNPAYEYEKRLKKDEQRPGSSMRAFGALFSIICFDTPGVECLGVVSVVGDLGGGDVEDVVALVAEAAVDFVG